MQRNERLHKVSCGGKTGIIQSDTNASTVDYIEEQQRRFKDRWHEITRAHNTKEVMNQLREEQQYAAIRNKNYNYK